MKLETEQSLWSKVCSTCRDPNPGFGSLQLAPACVPTSAVREGGRTELIRKAATSTGRAEIKKRKITRYQCLADKKALDRLIARAPTLNRSKKNVDKKKWKDVKTHLHRQDAVCVQTWTTPLVRWAGRRRRS